ncbi:MAG: cytochrome c biogenesis protein [Gemmatimonadota bacterium]|nr:cytochrome c biogenesis protein [Gemmatimonadota bacterium]
MIAALHAVAVSLYLATAFLLGLSFARARRDLPAPAGWLVMTGAASHAAGLVTYAAVWGQLPLSGLGPVLSVIGLLIAAGAIAASRAERAGPLGLVLVPLCALLAGAALAIGLRPPDTAAVSGSRWLALHVVFAVVGYASLAVAFAAGLMYLLQFRELKGKHFGAVFRFFPPLDTLDRLGTGALRVGFVALSVALIVAWTWTGVEGGSPGPRNPQVIWGVLTWIVFVVALASRAGGARRSYRGALTSVVGFLVVVIAFLLLRLQLSGGGAFL